jgi:hypothetical protein
MISHNVIQAVREMLERHWDVYTIASKIKVSPDTVQSAIDIIQGAVL